MIMSAQEARELSLEYIGGDDGKKLEEISREVSRACRKGKYFYTGNGGISRNLADGLRNQGYEVQILANGSYTVIWDKYYE